MIVPKRTLFYLIFFFNLFAFSCLFYFMCNKYMYSQPFSSSSLFIATRGVVTVWQIYWNREE